VDGAESRTGEHRDRDLGDHRHVDRDPVALPDAEAGEHVRGLLHVAVEIRVGDRPLVVVLA
jgi:hypothetical protein